MRGNFWKAAVSGGELGDNTRAFFQAITSIGTFYLVAKLLTASTQILAGRWLGPSEYGLANVVIASSNLLAIPLQLGFAPAVSKFPAMETSQDSQADIVSTAIWVNLLWVLPCVALLYWFEGYVSRILQLSAEVYLWSLVCSCLLTCYTLMCSALQGVRLFSQRGKVEVIYASVFAATFAISFWFFEFRYVALVVSLLAALFFSSLAAICYLRDWIRPVVSKQAVRSIKSYALAPVINSIAMTLIMAATPIILLSYMSPREVGIYSAYNLGSVMIAGTLSGIVGTVVGPLSSLPLHNKNAWIRLFKSAPSVILGGIAFFCGTSIVVLKLVGNGYPVELLWLLLFAGSAALSLVFSIALTLLYYRDESGLWLGVGGMVISGVVCLAGSLWAIPRAGISGAALALLTSYGIGLTWCAYWGWKEINHGYGS